MPGAWNTIAILRGDFAYDPDAPRPHGVNAIAAFRIVPSENTSLPKSAALVGEASDGPVAFSQPATDQWAIQH
jgi:hypothetical protein